MENRDFNLENTRIPLVFVSLLFHLKIGFYCSKIRKKVFELLQFKCIMEQLEYDIELAKANVGWIGLLIIIPAFIIAKLFIQSIVLISFFVITFPVQIIFHKYCLNFFRHLEKYRPELQTLMTDNFQLIQV